jgi:hypothetical protein
MIDLGTCSLASLFMYLLSYRIHDDDWVMSEQSHLLAIVSVGPAHYRPQGEDEPFGCVAVTGSLLVG